uniref:DUF6651 domain-containing protein n=1 Tax=unclassified Moraxella TaxID=2685852 RepID=UPI002B408628
KLDENGHVVVQDGKPVYVYDDGKEVAFDALQATQKITQLNSEAKAHREAKEAVETKLKAFDGLDAQAARTALETVKNFDDKKLIDAGEVEKVKAETKKAFDEQLQAVIAERDGITQQYHQSMISGEFARSKVITEKTILPSDIMQAQFGKHFSIDEQGKLVAKYGDGNPIYSRINAGELASFDEALEMIIDAYPHKDNILKADTASGAGGFQSQGGKINKSFSECKTQAEKVAWLQAQE